MTRKISLLGLFLLSPTLCFMVQSLSQTEGLDKGDRHRILRTNSWDDREKSGYSDGREQAKLKVVPRYGGRFTTR